MIHITMNLLCNSQDKGSRKYFPADQKFSDFIWVRIKSQYLEILLWSRSLESEAVLYVESFWSLCFWCTLRLKIMSSLRLNTMWGPFGRVLLPLNSYWQLNLRPESHVHTICVWTLASLSKQTVWRWFPNSGLFRILQAGLKHYSRLA